MREEVVIRPYRQADWPRVEAIHDAARRMELALAGLSAAFVPLAEAAESEGLFEYTVRVAEADGEVAGFVAYGGDALAWLYVDPARMRRGIGKRLVRHVIQALPARPLLLETLSGNEPALRLYASMGFAVTDTLTGRMPGNEAFTVTVHCMRLA